MEFEKNNSNLDLASEINKSNEKLNSLFDDNDSNEKDRLKNSIYEDKARKIRRPGQIMFGVVFVIALMIMGLFWYFGMVTFESKFLAGTKINGFDVSNKTVTEATSLVSGHSKTLVLRVKLPDGSETKFNYGDLGGEFNPSDQVENLVQKQNKLLWFLPTGGNLKVKYSYDFDMSYVKPEIERALRNHIPDVDLIKGVKYNANLGKYEINNDTKVKTYSSSLLIGVVTTALQDNKTYYDLTKEGKVSRDLLDNVSNANKALKTDIKIKYGDQKIEIKKEDVATILSFDQFGLKVDEAKLHQYLTDVENKVQKDKGGYHYTYETSLLFNQIVDDIKHGHKENYVAREMREKIIKMDSVYNFCEESKKGTFIDINKSKQVMCVYSNGEVVYGAHVVTGDKQLGFDTPATTTLVTNVQPDKQLNLSDVVASSKQNKKVTARYWLQLGGSKVGFVSTEDGSIDKDAVRTNWNSDAYLLRNGSKGNIEIKSIDGKWLQTHVGTGTIVKIED